MIGQLPLHDSSASRPVSGGGLACGGLALGGLAFGGLARGRSPMAVRVAEVAHALSEI